MFKKIWVFVALVAVTWVIAVFFFKDILHLIFPYLILVVGVATILLYGFGGIKALIKSRIIRRYVFEQPWVKKKREFPPIIQSTDEQKCPRCKTGILRLISEEREPPTLPTLPKVSQFMSGEFNVILRTRKCEDCFYEITERDIQRMRRYFKDNEGNVWSQISK